MMIIGCRCLVLWLALGLIAALPAQTQGPSEGFHLTVKRRKPGEA